MCLLIVTYVLILLLLFTISDIHYIRLYCKVDRHLFSLDTFKFTKYFIAVAMTDSLHESYSCKLSFCVL